MPHGTSRMSHLTGRRGMSAGIMGASVGNRTGLPGVDNGDLRYLGGVGEGESP